MTIIAQIGNGWDWVVPVVVVILYVVSYLWNAFNGAQQKQRQNRPQQAAGERPLPDARQGQGRPRPAAPPAEEPVQDKLNAEIEEFLRRANERRTEKSRRAGKSKPAPAGKAEPQRPTRSKSKPEEERRESVAQSVQEHFGARNFDAREAHLTDDLSRSEAEMTEHLQQVFEHRLGSLGSSDGADGVAGPSQSSAEQSAGRSAKALAVAGVLVNQESLRQAILLREILDRPVDRW